MAYFKTESITVTTVANGSATAYSANTYNGNIQSIAYVKTDFADGVDFTITTENTSQAVWTGTNVNSSATKAPRQTVHDTAGDTLQHGNAAPLLTDHIQLVDERLKIVIAQGGNVKTGTFQLIVGG